MSKSFYRISALLLMLMFLPTFLMAQNYTVSGVVKSQTGEALIGANVFLKGTTLGAASEADGTYKITAPKGRYTIVCSYIGYEKVEYDINLTNNMEVNFTLREHEFSLSVEVIADRAKEQKTPVAFTDIDKKDIERILGSRDIPLVLNTTPSVFATDNGGGAGDARINVRGFNQRNIAIMINGVPVNDMENGWVYWSNWDGLGDATSSIQVQRGLTAVTLATPAVGGVINIVTDPTASKRGVFYKNEIGSGNFTKQTLFVHTGLIDNKFALTLGGVKKSQDGVVDGTWSDAYAYYLGAAYQVDQNNRLELYATGAPQRHGQRSWRLNAATYSHELARELGFSETALHDPKLAEQGILYNSNWNSLDPTYRGKQYWNDGTSNRYSPTFINERENYYHKPIVNFNWYSNLTKDLSLYTTLYWSGGVGGGSGTFGSMVWDYTLLQRVVDWNGTIQRNMNNIDTLANGNAVKVSRGILRNSVNNQWTLGGISKAFYKVNENLTTSFGLDVRYAEIEHYREVRDLLGGDYFYSNANAFDTPDKYYKKLGDKIDYFFTNTVSWAGAFAQAEYSMDRFTYYATAGYSMIKYDHTNHFRKAADGSELFVETDWIGGYQVKGGASFRYSADLNFYANAGYIARVPIFDQVIDDYSGAKIKDPKNEKILSFEAGANYKAFNNRLTAKANLYYTLWKDRAQSRGVVNPDGSEGLVFLNGISSSHAGLELELAYQVSRMLRFDVAGSFGNWKYTDDVSGFYVVDYQTNKQENYNYYIKDLKVGDAPQTQIATAVTVSPVEGLNAQFLWRYNTEYYADFDPFSRNDAADRAQVWQIPEFSLFELHFSYDVPVELNGMYLNVFAHVFNLFDELYVQDATDNSAYNAYKANGVNHSADDAEIYPGLPRTFNLGFSIRF